MDEKERQQIKDSNNGNVVSQEDQTQLMCNHIGQINKLARKYFKIVKDNPWMLDFLKQNLDKSEESI